MRYSPRAASGPGLRYWAIYARMQTFAAALHAASAATPAAAPATASRSRRGQRSARRKIRSAISPTATR